MLTWAAFGTAPSGARRERLEASPNWRDGRFVNALPPRHDMASALVKWIRGAPDREPRVEIPVISRRADEFAKPPPSGLRATWLGHSSTLIEIGGRRFLTDPVFSRRISPSPFVGPRRFFASPIAAADLPDLDAIVLSHDHFDHLDLETVRALRPTTFVVPLGVGAHLASWGIPEARIVELDWWQSTDIGGVELVCTPARHFSGRSPTTRDATLWCGWAFVGARHRVFFSGDTALFPGFSDIGQRLGPFDLTLMESGAYDAAWADVHIGPEQAVRAHEMLRGRVMLPVHWGTFNLALHPWTEPAERALVAARARGATLVVPRPGESIDPLSPPQAVRWWPEVPWTPAERAPVISSGMLAEAGLPTGPPHHQCSVFRYASTPTPAIDSNPNSTSTAVTHPGARASATGWAMAVDGSVGRAGRAGGAAGPAGTPAAGRGAGMAGVPAAGGGDAGRKPWRPASISRLGAITVATSSSSS